MKILAALAAVLVIITISVSAMIGWAIGINNQLVVLDQSVNEKWSQIQNVYQRRADLIPNLVETVKGYAKHERGTLEAVAKARAGATGIQVTPETLNDPAALQRFQAAQSQLTGALSRLLVNLEKYPDLKANQGFLALQAQLESTESRIVVERQRYNAAVLDYNNRVALFPGNIVAERAGYKTRAFFAADADAQKAPRVDFGK